MHLDVPRQLRSGIKTLGAMTMITGCFKRLIDQVPSPLKIFSNHPCPDWYPLCVVILHSSGIIRAVWRPQSNWASGGPGPRHPRPERG